MAFEAYLLQGTVPRSAARRLTYLLSGILHGAAVLIAVAYSFWHVEEVKPPAVTVTFISAAAAPPPPPPPPALGGASLAIKHRAALTRPKADAAPRTPPLLQPQVEPVVETPVPAPREVVQEASKEASKEATPSSVVGQAGPGKAGARMGTAGGVKGGVPGGSGTTLSSAATFLPPFLGARQKLSGLDPDFPAYLRTPGARYKAIVKICVGTSGAVESVTVLKRAHPILDQNVITKLKQTWRFKPWTVNGAAVPFCYSANFEFTIE